MDYKKLRNKIRYMIFREQATEIYVTEDLKVFGFKLRGIEKNAESTLVITNHDELDLSDMELLDKHGSGEIVNLHFTDLMVNHIYIPEKFYNNESIYQNFEKEILHRIEFEIEDSEIYNELELHLNGWNQKLIMEDIEEVWPSGKKYKIEKLKMHHAIWYKENL